MFLYSRMHFNPHSRVLMRRWYGVSPSHVPCMLQGKQRHSYAKNVPNVPLRSVSRPCTVGREITTVFVPCLGPVAPPPLRDGTGQRPSSQRRAEALPAGARCAFCSQMLAAELLVQKVLLAPQAWGDSDTAHEGSPAGLQEGWPVWETQCQGFGLLPWRCSFPAEFQTPMELGRGCSFVVAALSQMALATLDGMSPPVPKEKAAQYIMQF